MPWTKQHFELIAQILNRNISSKTEEVIEDLTDDFSDVFRDLNPNFNPDRFENSVFREERSNDDRSN